MDINIVKKLVKILEESKLTDLEIEEEGFRIYLSKKSEVHTVVQNIPSHTVNQQANLSTTQPSEQKSLSELSKESQQEVSASVKPTSNLYEIKSPIVGTFYSAPSPDAEPFVKIGDIVTPGKVLCIIEAMKLMNEIECDVSGKVAKILVSNGEPVEYNQPLFLIEI